MKDIIEAAAKAVLHFWYIFVAIAGVGAFLFATNLVDFQLEAAQDIKQTTQGR